MGNARSDDSGKHFPESGDSGDYFSEIYRNIVKLGKWKSLVTVAGGDLAEIRTLLKLPQKWRNSKMGIIRSDDSGNTFSKVAILGNNFREIPVKS